MTTILRDATLVTNVLWPKEMNHLLKEMSAERDEYLKILRQTDSTNQNLPSCCTKLPDFE